MPRLGFYSSLDLRPAGYKRSAILDGSTLFYAIYKYKNRLPCIAEEVSLGRVRRRTNKRGAVMWVDVSWVLLGLLLLVVGADLLVKGAVGMARKFSVPPLAITLVV